MEQIETQASDLRFLAQAPVPLSNSPSISYETPRPGTHASPAGSASFGDNSASQGDGANKRKSLDDGALSKQTRSKRNRVSFFFVFPGLLLLDDWRFAASSERTVCRGGAEASGRVVP